MGKFMDEQGLTELWQLVKENDAKAPKIVTGSYVGDGKYGAENPVTLKFDFEPKFLIVTFEDAPPFRYSEDVGFCLYDCRFEFIKGITTHKSLVETKHSPDDVGFHLERENIIVNFSGNEVSWYLDAKAEYIVGGTTYYYPTELNAAHQNNESGKVYHYIAISCGGENG